MVKNLYSILMALLVTSCMGLNETDPSAYIQPDIDEVSVSEENTLYLTLSSLTGSIKRIKSCGFYCSMNEDMTDAIKIAASMNMSNGSFTSEALLKDYESDYYICSYISNGEYELRSDSKKITIGPLEDYVEFKSFSVDSYVSSTQKAEVTVSFKLTDGVDMTSCGICYGETTNLSMDGSYELAKRPGDDYFTASISSIVPGKQYYVLPFIKDGDDVAYGEVYPLNVYSVPEVETSEVKDITDGSARIYGEVKDDCGKDILERGFVLAEGDTKPTVNSKKHSVSGTKGEFDLNIEGLKPNSLYSVSAYAVNAEGTAYGNVINFTTNVALPTVVTETVTNITSSTAYIKCKISDNGGETPTGCGVLVSTTSDVDPAKSKKVSVSAGTSSFTVPVTGLNRKTKYYVQAYVTNSAGTSYGKTLEFETKAERPTVSTLSVSEITDISAQSGGDITDDGGDIITARGVVWGSTKNPTITSDSKTSDGTGTGKYTSHLAGLRFETTYYVRAYATNSAGTAYGEVLMFTTAKLNLDDIKNLAATESANCYIVSEPGSYRFPAVKGNSRESVGNVTSVEVLWESFGTSVTPKKGALVSQVLYSDGNVIFKVADDFREGNAVVAAKNSSGTILWSWHIWLTDYPAEHVYANNAGIMMDRNLGATSANSGDVGALGLLYQWGRKDPFLSSSSISGSVVAKSNASWPSYVESSQTSGTLDYSIKNPMVFITENSSNSDWLYTGSSSNDNTRWQSDKTIYDPCPSGWRVPDGGSNGVWACAGFDGSYNSIKKGVLIGLDYSTPSTWYPCAGLRTDSSGSLLSVGSQGEYWSVTPASYAIYCLYLSDFGKMSPELYYGARAYGRSVRCLKTSEIGVDTEGFGGSDYEW